MFDVSRVSALSRRCTVAGTNAVRLKDNYTIKTELFLPLGDLF